ncbi:hypothetical protein [Nocardia sp. NBC_00416]
MFEEKLDALSAMTAEHMAMPFPLPTAMPRASSKAHSTSHINQV